MITKDRIRQRLLIEEVIRKRRSDDAERFVEIFRRSTVDPNPHQIEAAMFALRRLPAGGAMLCDEVGLGKTIEAGLVITQLRAQGKSHVLIIVPLSLARQWQVELEDLFSLKSVIVGAESISDTYGRGIFIVGREFASSQKGTTWLQTKGPWDLVVIDEAHEMFAAIHSRFSKTNGDYLKDIKKGGARRAAQVKELIEGSPLLLLTATPLQNNLYELWGLVQYIDPDHQILGRYHEFCSLFVTGEGGRAIVPSMEETLRNRLALVLKRTLRRQAQPFMKQPFRDRHVHTANFHPGKSETELYKYVSGWLAQEKLAAYKRGHRGLMALQLRRRLASSIEALVSTLAAIRERMLKIQRTGEYPSKESFDLELEDLDDEHEPESVDMELLQQDLDEITKIEDMARRLLKEGAHAKKQKLLEVIKQIQARAIEGIASDKVVIFTESLRTLRSLAEFLAENGFFDQVTTFAGTNDGEIAERALAIWQEEIGRFQSKPLEPAAAIRAALVHEFKTRTKIFIATEAGAKGLNLQFCNCLINYDLPWNPQRIEQRIGRVHRYGQQHDVVIVNFINLSNEAEQRVYQLLEEKLHVFTETLGASDSIVSTPELALNLEARINEILDRCRTPEEIQDAFDRLNLELDEAARQMRDEKLESVRQLLGDLDSTVRARLGKLEDDLGHALSKCDQTLLEILRAEGDIEVLGADGPRTLINWNGRLCHLGPPAPGAECGEPIHREHPDVQAVIQRCIEATDGQTLYQDGEESNSWKFYRVRFDGLEQEERLLVVGDGPVAGIDDVADDLQSGLARMKHEAERHQREYVDRLITQFSSRREDLRLCGNNTLADLQRKLEAADRSRRMAGSAAALSKAQAQQKKLLNEIEQFKKESAAEIERRSRELDEDERRIRLMQFVDVQPTLLFELNQIPSPERTLA